jgi:ANTAR domain
MERYNISADRSFAVLVRVSQHNNRKLRDVAEELISSRQLRTLQQRALLPRDNLVLDGPGS